MYDSYLQVTKNKTWKDIAGSLGIGASSSAAYTLRKHYTKHLLPFECKFDRGGIDPLPLISQVESTTSKSKKGAKIAPIPSPGSSNSQDSFSGGPNNNSSMDGFSSPPFPPYGSGPGTGVEYPQQTSTPPSSANAMGSPGGGRVPPMSGGSNVSQPTSMSGSSSQAQHSGWFSNFIFSLFLLSRNNLVS